MVMFEDFKKNINDENMVEINNLKLSMEWLYKEYLEVHDLEEYSNYDFNQCIKAIIYDYIDELLYREFNKYDLDWE